MLAKQQLFWNITKRIHKKANKYLESEFFKKLSQAPGKAKLNAFCLQ